jgi:hypothetical protein
VQRRRTVGVVQRKSLLDNGFRERCQPVRSPRLLLAFRASLPIQTPLPPTAIRRHGVSVRAAQENFGALVGHTQRLRLHALLGARPAAVGPIRAIWGVQDKLALNADEEKAIEKLQAYDKIRSCSKERFGQSSIPRASGPRATAHNRHNGCCEYVQDQDDNCWCVYQCAWLNRCKPFIISTQCLPEPSP